jgi:hypothetical protein
MISRQFMEWWGKRRGFSKSFIDWLIDWSKRELFECVSKSWFLSNYCAMPFWFLWWSRLNGNEIRWRTFRTDQQWFSFNFFNPHLAELSDFKIWVETKWCFQKLQSAQSTIHARWSNHSHTTSTVFPEPSAQWLYLFDMVKNRVESIQASDSDIFFEEILEIRLSISAKGLERVFAAWTDWVHQLSEENGDYIPWYR